MVGREGFEPSKAKPTGLQPVPFGRSGTDPWTGHNCTGQGQLCDLVVVEGRAFGRRHRRSTVGAMPTFDVVSEVDMQEVRNAVDQAAREVSQRFDFKGTDSSVELGDDEIKLASSSEDRLAALRVVLEEKFAKRKVSMKVLDYGTVEPASGGSVRQTVKLQAGINADKARELNKFIKGLGLKGVQSSTQGEQLRVSGKKRDDLQAAIAALKEQDFGIPLQFNNFRD